MRSTTPVNVVLSTAVFTLTLIFKPPAAHCAPTDDKEQEARRLTEEGRYREAALKFEEAFRSLPESGDNRAQRNRLASGAINTYAEAFKESPGECGLALAGLDLADDYLAGLLAVYGMDVKGAPEYTGIAGRRGELDNDSRKHSCERPTPTGPTAQPEDITTGDSSVPTEDVPFDESKPSRQRPLVAAFATSAVVTGVLVAVSLGTGLSRYKAPIQGAAYSKIYNAARDSYTDDVMGNEVDYAKDSDMCSKNARMVNTEVDQACADWTQLGKAALATGIAAGLTGITAVALGVTFSRRQRYGRSALSRLRRHQATVGVLPSGRRGGTLTFGLRF
ncbi:MAG: hypothetical protein R3B09_08675 [Nannocystaceae bacterium]